MTMQAQLCVRILRAGEMAGQSIPTNGILTGRSLVSDVPVQLAAPVETPVRGRPHDHAGDSQRRNQHLQCRLGVAWRARKVEPLLSKSNSKIARNRNGLAKRTKRVLKVNGIRLPVADAARDVGTDVAGGGRRRRIT